MHRSLRCRVGTFNVIDARHKWASSSVCVCEPGLRVLDEVEDAHRWRARGGELLLLQRAWLALIIMEDSRELMKAWLAQS